MDIIVDSLPQLRIKQAWYTRVESRSPWGFEFIPYRHTKFGIVHHGRCYLDLMNGEEPVLLEQGSCYLLPRGDAFRLRDIHKSETINFEDALPLLDGRTIRYGGEGESCTIIGGRFIFADDIYPLILDLLPPLVHFKVEASDLAALEATIYLLANETSAMEKPSKAMINRVAELFFIQTLRAYLDSKPESQLGWLGAVNDEKLATTLRLIHNESASHWTIAELAKRAGMSRAVLAAKFKQTLGTSPIAYLTRYRLDRAQSLLQQSSLSIAQIAEKVGYDSEASFHKAFKRELGIAPGQFRRMA